MARPAPAILATFALLTVLSTAACRPAQRVYLLTDSVMRGAVGGDGGVGRMAGSAARRAGLDFRSLDAPDDNAMQAALARALGDAACRVVVALTASPLDARELARSRPDVLFAAYGERGPAAPANLLLLVAERSEAYREAGRRVGALLEKDGAAGGRPRAGILAVSPSLGATREIAAFRAGLAEAAPAAVPAYRELRSASDKAGVVRLVRELRSDGAVYYVLKAYGLTVACLEELAREGGRAVVEDCEGASACGNEVVFSVETDWPATFAAIVQEAAPAEGAWRSPEVQERWRLVDHDADAAGG